MGKSPSIETRKKLSEANILKKPRGVVYKSPHIDSNSIQAILYPEIANTCCHLKLNGKDNKRKNSTVRHWYQKKHGQIPKELFACHKCDNLFGRCYNLDHIFLGTQKDNMQDCLKKHRNKRWENSHV
jgi:hypothetical protein